MRTLLTCFILGTMTCFAQASDSVTSKKQFLQSTMELPIPDGWKARVPVSAMTRGIAFLTKQAKADRSYIFSEYYDKTPYNTQVRFEQIPGTDSAIMQKDDKTEWGIGYHLADTEAGILVITMIECDGLRSVMGRRGLEIRGQLKEVDDPGRTIPNDCEVPSRAKLFELFAELAALPASSKRRLGARFKIDAVDESYVRRNHPGALGLAPLDTPRPTVDPTCSYNIHRTGEIAKIMRDAFCR
jgi:hypothetical protein